MSGGIAHDIARKIDELRNLLDIQKNRDMETARRHVDALKDGKILFYGEREVEVGLEDMDWSGGHVHHQEWTAQLNRFFWLQHVGVVYRETGDEELPAIARKIIEDWIDQHDLDPGSPLPLGDNTLNLSIRLGQFGRSGWWGTLPDLADSPHYDEEFVREMLASTREQLDYLSENLTPVGNWRISQLNCLLFCSLVLPDMDDFRPLAVRHLNEAFHRQIEEDGSHEEHTPSYHGWMCRLFTILWHLSRTRPDLGLQLDSERVVRMWDYALCSKTPDGGSCALHDSSAWEPGEGTARLEDKRKEVLREAEIDLSPDMGPEKNPSRWFPDAGQLFLRDGWNADATFLTFDATRWGMSHCHLSRLGVGLYSGGRMLLCDPGIFSYEMSDPFAAYGKSTPAHNTVNVRGMNQSEANPDTYRVHLGETAAIIGSRYEGGYWSGRYTWGWKEGKGEGIFGAHDRILLWLPGRCALVFDVIYSDGDGEQYAAHWQCPPGPLSLDRERLRAWTDSGDSNVMVQCLQNSGEVDISVHEGERDPLLGWLPQGRGGRDYLPAPLVAMEGRASTPGDELVTLLLPFQGEGRPDVEIEILPRRPGEAWGFRFGWPDRSETLVAVTPALSTQIDRIGPLSTDASAAVLDLVNGDVARCLILDGMRLEYEDTRLIAEDTCGTYELNSAR